MSLTKCHVADVLSVCQRRQVPDLERRFTVRIQDLRRSLTRRPTTGVDKLLQKHFAVNSIRFFFEHGRKDDGHAIDRRLDVDGFFRAVMIKVRQRG